MGKTTDKSRRYYAFCDDFPVCWSYDLTSLRRYISLYVANGMSGTVTIQETINTVETYPYILGPKPVLYEAHSGPHY